MLENNQENELKQAFKDTVAFLRRFATLLHITQGQDQNLITGNDFGVFSKEFMNLNEYAMINIQDIFQQYQSELSKEAGINNDINSSVRKLSYNCLSYIINLLRGENADVMEIFEYFSDLKKCFLVFGASSVLDAKEFKELLSYWIIDLLKLITEADGVPRACPEHLATLNVIKRILTSLAECNTYCDLIISEIVKKLECVLSYYTTWKEFGSYIASKTQVFAYLLWIMNSCVGEATNRGRTLSRGDIMEIRRLLKVLRKCWKDECPAVIKNVIDDILMMLE